MFSSFVFYYSFNFVAFKLNLIGLINGHKFSIMDIFLREGLRDLTNLSSSHSLNMATSAGDGHYFDDNDTDENFKGFLESNNEIDKLKGMKLLLAKLSKGRNISLFFPNVVKNVSSKSIELKKLVYIYLVHYADYDASCRQMALLSINSFQKDLMGTNALIRGMALRVMTSVRLIHVNI